MSEYQTLAAISKPCSSEISPQCPVGSSYENVSIRIKTNHADKPMWKLNQSVDSEVCPRKKLGSSRRARWLQRRRSRSIDSSEFLCDYSSIRKSTKIGTATYEKDIPESIDLQDSSDENIYEEALDVSLIKGVSFKGKNAKEKRKKLLSMNRKCMSMNDIDYENVRLQDPVDIDSQECIYEDPWNTADTLQMLLLKRQSMRSFTSLVEDSTEVEHDIRPNSAAIELGTCNERPTFKVNTKLPLLQQRWYHDEMSRLEAEAILNSKPVGAFLVRINSLQRKDLTLSLKTIIGVIHIRAVRQKDCRYILGEFSEPFESAAAMIAFYSESELKINGAPHTYLTMPIDCDLHAPLL